MSEVIIRAELDEETDALRKELRQRLGWTDSRIVQEAIKALASLTPRNGKRKLSGVGKYDTGITDMGSNKKHLADFGKNSLEK